MSIVASIAPDRDGLLRPLLLMFAQMPVGCMILDAKLRITRWNHAAEAMFGFLESEAVGRDAMELLVPAEERDVVRQRISILESTNDVVQGSTVNQTRDGSRVSCVWRNVTIRDAAGKVAGFLCMAENVTRQLDVIAELEVSLARFNELTGISAHWYWEQDKDLRFTMLSGAPDDRAYRNARFLGKTRAECRDRFIADDAAWDAHLRDLEARRPFKDFIYRSADHQGRIRVISVSGHPVFDARGSFQGYRGVSRDISAEHESKAQLQALNDSLTERNSRYLTVLEALAEGVVVLNDEMRIIDVNAAAERLLGRTAAELIGQRNSDVDADIIKMDGTPMAVHERPSMLALATGKPQFDCVLGTRGPGGIHWRSVNAVPIRNAEGRVTAVVLSMDDITAEKNTMDALRNSQEQLRRLAKFDPLTGLPNRAELYDRLRHALALADRGGNPLALLFIDLDRFKAINDSLGHAAGDLVLQEVATRLAASIRESDTVARQSGDEFIVVVENVRDENEIDQLCRRITADLSRPMLIKEQDVFVTPSIGIALYIEDAGDMMDLLRKADVAMYRAKRLGGNGIQFYSRGEDEGSTAARLSLEARLRRAVANGEFVLHYQPKLDLASGAISGMEALIRWPQADGSLVPPDQFITLAEETGLIAGLGRWALDEACRQNRQWQDAGMVPLPVAVNVSPIQFRENDLVGQVASVLEKHRLEPRFLELEITENLTIGSVHRAESTIQALRAMGVSIAIDDFGTGYSSLSYLMRFPVSSLKIDRQFTMNVPDREESVVVTKAIIAMAATLKMRVVAEGVETIEQLQFLRGANCDEAQGYLISQPLPAPEFEEFMKQDRETRGAGSGPG